MDFFKSWFLMSYYSMKSCKLDVRHVTWRIFAYGTLCNVSNVGEVCKNACANFHFHHWNMIRRYPLLILGSPFPPFYNSKSYYLAVLDFLDIAFHISYECTSSCNLTYWHVTWHIFASRTLQRTVRRPFAYKKYFVYYWSCLLKFLFFEFLHEWMNALKREIYMWHDAFLRLGRCNVRRAYWYTWEQCLYS